MVLGIFTCITGLVQCDAQSNYEMALYPQLTNEKIEAQRTYMAYGRTHH